jgi:tetratricopeptide (TPR) repeat protein
MRDAIPARPLNLRVRLGRQGHNGWAAAFLAASILSNTTFAAEHAGKHLFETGRAAFEKQDYRAAMAAFEGAAQAGFSGPAVHFNIGVSAFRVGDYERAELAFLEVARTPAMAALAHYNLGLIALKSDDPTSASSWFARAQTEATDERLRALAGAQLANLPTMPARDWVGYASVTSGYDDNVALVSDSDVLGVSGMDDLFTEAQLALSAPLSRPWRFDAGAVLTKYQELDRFDQLSTQAGARYRLSSGPWINYAAFRIAYSTLDGDGFENRQILALQTKRDLFTYWQWIGRLRLSNIEGLNEYSGLDGHNHEISARISRTIGQWNLGFEYEFESSDHADDLLSAKRHTLAFDARRPILAGWSLSIDFRAQDAVYEVEGTEDLLELTLAGARALSERWTLVLRYSHSDNRSNLSEFDYDRTQLSASIEAAL